MLPGEIIKEKCGTPAYLAPEVIREEGYTGFNADVWSLGVLLFYLLAGTMPFKAKDVNDLKLKILTSDVDFAQTSIDCQAQDLLEKMLQKDPSKRVSLQKVL